MSGDNDKLQTLPTVVGIGAGTGLLGLANTIPDEYPFLKHLAVYASPAATIGVQWAWIFVSFWITAVVTKKTADYGVKKIRILRDEALNDPHATDDHKKEMQEQCEKLERIAAESIANNVKMCTKSTSQKKTRFYVASILSTQETPVHLAPLP